MSVFSEYLPLIATLASAGSLLVWIFYAHLLYVSFRRNERPRVLIHQAHSGTTSSHCLIVNLSRQPLHVVTVDMVLTSVRANTHTLRINDYQRISSDDESDWAAEDVMKEGPLKSGDFLSLGGFRSMLSATREDESTGDEPSGSDETNEARTSTQEERIARQTRQVEIRVSALFSSYTYPIGASRCFEVVMEDTDFYLQPLTPVTSQLNTRRQRGQLYRSLKRFEDKQGSHKGLETLGMESRRGANKGGAGARE